MAKKDGDTRIAIVGTGLIGRAWAIVFAPISAARI